MEVRMKTCPQCGKQYNAKFFPVCPNCSGGAIESEGFVHTTPVETIPNNAMLAGQPYPNGNAFAQQPNFDGGFGNGMNGVTEAIPSHPQNMDDGYYSPESFGTPTEIGGAMVGLQKLPPVVGWLVAVSGALSGTDFRIHANYNPIGRTEGDIIIGGDPLISRKDDCAILYHVQSERFFIEHRNGTNAISVNKEPVVGGAVEIKAYDTITIGETDLKFIPLCGENFKW